MRPILASLLLSLTAFGALSCAETPAQQAASPDPSTFVHVAVIDPQVAEHVTQVLERAGIRPIIEGSVVYGVSVAPEAQAQAHSLLRADAEAEKYWIQFP